MEDRLPGNFADTYRLLRQGGARSVVSTGAADLFDDKAYAQLVEYAAHARRGSMIRNLLQEIGVAHTDRAATSFARHMSKDEANQLGYMITQGFASSKAGQVGNTRNLNDANAMSRSLRSDSPEQTAYLDMMRILSSGGAVPAQVENFQKTQRDWSDDAQLFHGSRKINGTARQTIQKTFRGRLRPMNTREDSYQGALPYYAPMGMMDWQDAYFIPSTYLQADGKLAERVQGEWRQPTNYRQQRWLMDHDRPTPQDVEWVTMSDSALTRKLGMHGNGTYGAGRDASQGFVPAQGQAMPVIQIETAGHYIRDPKTGRITGFDDPSGQLTQFYSRQGTLSHGGQEYVFSHQNGTRAYGILKDRYDAIRAEEARLALPSSFDNYNLFGTIGATYQQTMKQIDVARKEATPSTPLSRLGFSFNDENARSVILNTGALYGALDQLGIQHGTPMDGVAFMDPSMIHPSVRGKGFSAAQIRDAGVIKEMMQVTDWRKLFTDSGLFDVGRLGDLMQTDAQGNRHLYLPGQAATAEDVISLMQGNLSERDRDLLLESRFFDAMDRSIGLMHTDTGVKNLSQFRFLTDEEYIGQNSQDALLRAKEEGRIISGLEYAKETGDYGGLSEDELRKRTVVRLNEQEIQRNLARTSAREGGPAAVELAQQFEGDSRFMSAAAFMSLGSPQELLKRSTANYSAYLESLRTQQGVIDHVINADESLRRRYDESADFLYSDEVQQRVESRRQEIINLRDREKSLMLDEGDVYTALATLGPQSIVEPIAKAVGTSPSELSKKVEAANPGLAALLRQDENNIVYAMSADRSGAAVSGRFPAAPSTLVRRTIENKGTAVDYLRALGYGDGQAVLTSSQQYTHNTGDFDGDTVQLYFGLSEYMLDLLDEQNKKIAEAQG